MRRLLQNLLGIVIIVTSVGCGSSTDDDNVTADLIPLSSGNRWIYNNYIVDTLTHDTTLYLVDTAYVGLSTILENDRYFFYNNFIQPTASDPAAGIVILRNAAHGVWTFDEPRDTAELLFKYPASAGETYIVLTDSSGLIFDGSAVTKKVTVLATDKMVTVAKGSFSCYHYRMFFEFYNPRGGQQTIDMGDFYISSSVGIIKTIILSEVSIHPNRIQLRMLKDYSVL